MKFHFIFFSTLYLLPFIGSAENVGLSLKDLLQQRHSGYAYDANQPVSKEHIHQLIEAVRTTPSCFNDQPWHFIIADKISNPSAYEKILNSLIEFNKDWAQKAPVLVVIVADSKFHKNDKDNRWAQYDTGAAAFTMMLKAVDLGLMAHQMGGFDEKRVQADFQIPSRYTPMAVMTLGYEMKGEPIKPKEKKAVDENFFRGAWGLTVEKK